MVTLGLRQPLETLIVEFAEEGRVEFIDFVFQAPGVVFVRRGGQVRDVDEEVLW